MKNIHPHFQHLHDRIAFEVRKQLFRDHRPGDRIDTEPVLAHRFGVSIPTIRNAMLVLEREGLVERRQGSGTYVCDRRARQHVGIAISDGDLGFPAIFAFHLSAARRVWEQLEASGYRVKLYAASFKADPDRRQVAHAELVEAAEQGRLAALVVFTMLPAELSELLCAAGVVLTGFDDRAAARVEFDYENMVNDGLDHLAQAGRRDIALIGWGAPHYRRIGDVFADAMVERGLQVRHEWIHDDLPASSPGSGWDAFREIWSARGEKPDGLLICDDILYRDATLAIRELGIRVPEDLMIVAHSNKGTNIPHLFPVTLLQFDPGAHAEILGQATLSLLRGESLPKIMNMLGHQVVPAQPIRMSKAMIEEPFLSGQ